MAKFKYFDLRGEIICENDDLESFWEDLTKTDYFECDIISYLWECLTNYDSIKNKFPTMNYLYPFVKEYVKKLFEIDCTYDEDIQKYEKVDNIITDIITTICKNDDYCRDLIMKDFPEFKVD
jgi:GTP1/Obg family GTP-binding protein